MNVDLFLSQLEESRQREQAAAHAGFVMPPGLQLPAALEIAIEHRWLIAPVRGCSSYALSNARVGWPTSCRDQINFWYATHLDVNWMVQTGAKSGLMALEIDTRYVHLVLVHLAGSDNSWRRSLQYASCGKWMVLFSHVPGMRTVGERYLGLRLHAGDAIYLPPFVNMDGIRIEYAEQYAPVLAPPEWLVSAFQPK